MSCLKIHLFGPFEVSLDGQPISQFDTEKTRALLAYLASEPGHAHQRESLAEILWPERPPGAARANLRHSLSILRELVGDRPTLDFPANKLPFLLVRHDTIQINPESSVWVDTAAFSAITAGLTPGAVLPEDQLEEAVALYRGLFLEDVSLKDSVQFQEWLLSRREQLARLASPALLQLASRYEQSGDYERALHHARRMVNIEPWDEHARRQVMRLLFYTGQRNAALAEYEACVRTLADELGIQPDPETTRLGQSIRDRRLVSSAADSPLPGFMQEGRREIPPPIFVAREKELSVLHAFLERALAGSVGMAFIIGGPGQGKTALMGEFTRQALDAHPDLLAAAGICSAISGAGNAYMPFCHMLSMLTGDVEDRWATGSISRTHARRLWSTLPVVIPTLLEKGPSLVGKLLSGEVLLNRMKSALIDQPEWLAGLQELIERKQMGRGDLDQRFLFDQYSELLNAVASRQPLVLLLDDFQWADMASLDLLFYLARRLAGAKVPILFVCAYRPEEITSAGAGDRHPLENVLQEIKCIFGDNRVDLDNVGELESRRFVDGIVDTERNRLSDEFRETLCRRTAGHPLFTIELLREMHERGEIIPDAHADGAWIEGPALNWDRLPIRVEAVIESRFRRLDLELRENLCVASVEGEQFSAQVVAAVQNSAEIRVLRGLRKLEKLYRLVKEIGELKSGDFRTTRFQFNHLLVREYVYRQLSPGEQRIYHGKVADALVDQYGSQEDEFAAQLSYHYYRAEIFDQAYRYAVMAARKAAGAFAHFEAINLYTSAIELAAKTTLQADALINLHLGRGQAYEISGDFERAREDFKAALELSRLQEQQRLEWRALLSLAELWTSRDYDRSLEFIQSALDLSHRIEDPALIASSLNWVGNWHTNAEDPVAALDYHQEALQIFETSGAMEEVAGTFDRLGLTSLLRGDMTASVRYYDRAVALFREQKDPIGLADSLTGRGLACSGPCLNQTLPAPAAPGDALQDLNEALQIARQIHSPSAEAWALWALSLLTRALGRFGEALDCIRGSLEIASNIGHLEWVAGSHSILGELYTEMLAPEAAQPHLKQALTISQKLASQHWFHHACGASAASWYLLGDLERALACLAPVIKGSTAMDTIHKRMCWAKRAEIAICMGEPTLALDIVDRLIASIPDRITKRVPPLLWMLKGEALSALRREGDALPLLRVALDNTQAAGAQVLSWRVHASLGRLHAAAHQDEGAERHFAAARHIIDEIARTIPDEAQSKDFVLRANRMYFNTF